MGRTSTGGSGGGADEAEKRARLKLVRYRLGQAILCRAEVWMSYDGGTVVKVPRAVLPKTWGTEPMAATILREVCSTGDHHHRYFKAVCLKSGIIKTFAVHKVLEVRSREWELGDPPQSDDEFAAEVRLTGELGANSRGGDGSSDDDDEVEGGDEEEFAPTDSTESFGATAMPWEEMVECARADYAKYCQAQAPVRGKRRKPKHPDVEASELNDARCFLRVNVRMRMYISPASFPAAKAEAASLLVGAHGGALVSSFDTNNSTKITHLLRDAADTAFEDTPEFMAAVRHGVDVVDETFLQDIVNSCQALSYYSLVDFLWEVDNGQSPPPALSLSGSGSHYERFNEAPPAAQQAADYNDYYGQGDKYRDYAYGEPADKQGLTYMENGSRFWQILLDGCTTKVSYGSIGKKARRPLIKEHSTLQEAFQHATREIRQKASKGYVEQMEAPDQAYLVYEMLPPSETATPPPSSDARPPVPDDDDDGEGWTPPHVQGGASEGGRGARRSTRSSSSTGALRAAIDADRYSQMDFGEAERGAARDVGDGAARGGPANHSAYAGQHELVEFLKEYNLSAYADEFIGHELRTADLLHVSDDEVIKQIGIEKLGHQTRLRRALNALRARAEREASEKQSGEAAEEQAGSHYESGRAVLAEEEGGTPSYDGAEEVLRWLESIRLERYAPCFFAEEMDLESVATIETMDQLREIGVDKLGPQNKLMRAIKELREGGLAQWVKSSGDAPPVYTPAQADASTNRTPSEYAVQRDASDTSSAGAGQGSPSARAGGDVSLKHIVRDVVVGKKVGSGHFGEVYQGMWQDQMHVALKKITKEDSDGMREFEAEASVLMDLRHPNIVTFYGVYVDTEAQRFIVLEWANQGGLDSYLRNNSHRTVQYKDLLGFAIDAARGMMYLSERSPPVVHRDLALRNLLLTKSDGRLQVKVGDFGLSRETNFATEENEEEQVYMTAHQTAMPIKWIAPETVHTRQFSSRSDVWSFGIVLWEMFTFGGVPYPRMTSREVLSQLRTGYRMAKPTLCTSEVYDVMMACWHDDPFLRPAFRNVYNILLKLRKDHELQLAEEESAAATASAAGGADAGGGGGAKSPASTYPQEDSSMYDAPSAASQPAPAASSGWQLPSKGAPKLGGFAPSASGFASAGPGFSSTSSATSGPNSTPGGFRSPGTAVSGGAGWSSGGASSSDGGSDSGSHYDEYAEAAAAPPAAPPSSASAAKATSACNGGSHYDEYAETAAAAGAAAVAAATAVCAVGGGAESPPQPAAHSDQYDKVSAAAPGAAGPQTAASHYDEYDSVAQ